MVLHFVAVSLKLFLGACAGMQQHFLPRHAVLQLFRTPLQLQIAPQAIVAEHLQPFFHVIADVFFDAEEAFDEVDGFLREALAELLHLLDRQIVPRRPAARLHGLAEVVDEMLQAFFVDGELAGGGRPRPFDDQRQFELARWGSDWCSHGNSLDCEKLRTYTCPMAGRTLR